MLNVLGLVSFRIFPTHMGGQKGVAVFYQYLKQYANIILALSDDNQESTEISLQKVLHPNKKMPLNFFRLKELKKIVAENNIDIIIAEHSYTGWLAWRLHKATGKPFVIHSHNIESKRFLQMHKWWWKLYHRYEKWIHHKADHSFFISEEDLSYADREFGLPPAKCSVITYGIEETNYHSDKAALRKALGLDENKTLLLFNGTLDYTPNYDAVVSIIENIEPLLQKKLSNYQIIITGNRARKDLIEKMMTNKNVLYLGYVDDVNLYYKAADLFINPVSNDTGVKTKLIEAIANNCTAVSTTSGASGIRKDLCGNKLIAVPENDWNSFVNEVFKQINAAPATTPQSFYDHYSWQNITKKVSEKLNELCA